MPRATTAPTTFTRDVAPRPDGPVLVATTAQSGTGALRLGRLLAARRGGTPVLVSAVEEMPAAFLGGGLGPLPSSFDATLRDDRRAAVARQARDVLGEGERADLPIEVVSGEPGLVLASAVRRHDASLLVVGSGRHGIGSRLLFGETALRIIRRAECPVLVVPEEQRGLPRVAVAAIDFTPSSVAAARAALRLLGDGATLQLVHVWTPLGGTESWMRERDRLYAERLPAQFARVVEVLEAPPTVEVTTTTLEGRPLDALLAYLPTMGADLVAAGRRHRGPLDRLLLGRLVTGLVRGAPCAVLAAPPPLPADSAALAQRVHGSFESRARDEWPAQLEGFTRRNRGRRTMLEIDDSRLGVRAQELGYPLAGAAYDPHDRRVELSFGEGGSEGPHLTHFIPHVSAVAVVGGGAEGDSALRVEHRDGRTLLTFPPPHEGASAPAAAPPSTA